jgi:ribosomal protein L25 (general stress protein Ctc)
MSTETDGNGGTTETAKKKTARRYGTLLRVFYGGNTRHCDLLLLVHNVFNRRLRMAEKLLAGYEDHSNHQYVVAPRSRWGRR